MKRERAKSLLEKFGVEGIYDCGDFIRFVCPYRHYTHRDLGRGRGNSVYALDITKSIPKGFCFVCKDHSTLSQMLLHIAIFKKDEELYKLAQEVSAEIEDDSMSKIESAYDELRTRLHREKVRDALLEDLRDWFDLLPKESDIMSGYLAGRGYSPDVTIDFFGLRYDPMEKRVVFPLFDFYTKGLLGAQGRATDGRMPKVKHYAGSKASKTFTMSGDPTRDKALLIVEGPFDCVRLALQCLMEGISVLALNGASISEHQASILEKVYKPTYVLLDNDEAGRKGSAKIELMLGKKIPKLEILSLPSDRKDPDELSEEEITRLVRYINDELDG